MRMIRSPRAASALAATLSCLSVVFDSAPAFGAMQINQVVSGLTNPLFVGHAGDGSNRLFIVERAGVIKVLQPGSSTPTIFLEHHARRSAPAVSAAWPGSHSTRCTKATAASSSSTRARAR